MPPKKAKKYIECKHMVLERLSIGDNLWRCPKCNFTIKMPSATIIRKTTTKGSAT